MLKVYVIAAYQSAPEVRAIHDRLRIMGHEPTSSWAEGAHGAEDLTSLSDVECFDIWARNHADMADADVVMMLADSPCREGWSEFRSALTLGKRILYVGRPTLSVRAIFGRAVERVFDIEEALTLLSRRADTIPAGAA